MASTECKSYIMKSLELKIEKNIATICLNRPDFHNALNQEMINSLIETLPELNKNKDIRAIVFRGKGKSFSSGADLNYMKGVAELSFEENLQDAKRLAELFYLIYSSPKFTISLAHGFVTGGANGIIAASDFVLAEKLSKFRFSEVRLGLVPATISPYVISRCGYSNSLEVMLSAESFSAKKARKLGLVNQLFTSGDMDDSLNQLLSLYLSSGPSAMVQTKRLLQKFNHMNISSSVIADTAELIARTRASEEANEGINAFFEKRKPFWINQ
jgi:methylglutaconyl-CoA hydratase